MRVTINEIKNKYPNVDVFIFELPGFLGLILFFINQTYYYLLIGIILGGISLFLSMILPNVYATDKLIFSEEQLEIQGEKTIKWTNIHQIKIYRTEARVPNNVKVVIYTPNSETTTFFLCKKSITEWELTSMQEFIEKIPKEVKLRLFDVFNGEITPLV